MLKIAGILVLCVAVSGVGFLYDAYLREQINLLTKMERLVEYLHCRIQYTHTDIFTLFSAAADEADFNGLGFLKAFSTLKQDWNALCIQKNISAKFPQRDLALSFFTGLGQTDISGQLAHCEIYRSLFAEKRELYHADYITKGKIYRTLGAFSAAGLAIVLI